MIRVAVLDDHPAVLAGLHRLLEATGDVHPVAAADTADALLRALDRERADVAIVDYDLGRSDGLTVCQRLKERVRAPRVVVYSAYVRPAVVLAARIAGADAVVDKRAPASGLVDAVRRVARGEAVFPEVPHELRHALVAGLEDDEMAVAAMLLAGTHPGAVADALRVDRAHVASRTRRIVARLRSRQVARAAPARDRDAWSPGATSPPASG